MQVYFTDKKGCPTGGLDQKRKGCGTADSNKSGAIVDPQFYTNKNLNVVGVRSRRLYQKWKGCETADPTKIGRYAEPQTRPKAEPLRAHNFIRIKMWMLSRGLDQMRYRCGTTDSTKCGR